jgi:predicted transposase YbfD/YdcC
LDRRRLWLTLDDADYIREQLDFAGCQIALRVDRDVLAANGDVVSHDSRYFVASIDPGQIAADRLLDHVRDHWQVENSLFFVKDRWWDEDRHATRRPGLAPCLALLNSYALTVLRRSQQCDEPLRACADRIAWLPSIGLKLLGFQ